MLINAKLKSDKWTYTVASSIKLVKGRYRMSAYGTDKAGAFGNSAPPNRRIVQFTLK